MAKKKSKKKPTAIQVWQPGTNVPGFDQYNELNKKSPTEFQKWHAPTT